MVASRGGSEVGSQARVLTGVNAPRAAYYRGAMGILLVYDVTDEASFNNIRNWMKNIETHASSSVNKVGPCALCPALPGPCALSPAPPSPCASPSAQGAEPLQCQQSCSLAAVWVPL